MVLHQRAHVDHPPFLTQRRKGAKTQRPPSRPRRKHEGTKTRRIHEDANPRFLTQRPSIYPVFNAEAQRRRDAEGTILTFCVWRDSRPSDGREPLGMESAPKTSFRVGFHSQRPALSESAGLASSLLYSIDGMGTPTFLTMKEKRGRTDVPLARRPVRSPAATDARIRSRRASHRRQAIRSPVVLPPISGTTLQAQRPRLCGLCVLCGSKSAGWICVYLRYLRFLWMNGAVLICVICGQI